MLKSLFFIINYIPTFNKIYPKKGEVNTHHKLFDVSFGLMHMNSQRGFFFLFFFCHFNLEYS